MKTKILFLALTALCLASCNKNLIDTPTPGPELGDGDYMLEIIEEGAKGSTKSSPSTVQLNLANLVSASSKNISAQLKKRTSGGWKNVESGVSYAWSASSADNQKFSGSGTIGQTCTVSAKAKGSGTINVSASISGTAVANQDVPVTVSDDRALSWSNASTPITSGEVYSAVLNSNFSCTATVSSNNTSFLVGTTSSNLSKSTSVTFDSNKTKTIYYKYTGSNETTVKMDAKINAESGGYEQGIKCNIDIETSVIELSYIMLEGGLRGVTTYNLTGDDPTTEFLFYDDGEEMNFTFKRTYWSDDILEIGVYFDKLTVVMTDGTSQVITGGLPEGISLSVAGNPVYNLSSGTSFSVTEDEPTVTIMLDSHGSIKEFYLIFDRVGSLEEED